MHPQTIISRKPKITKNTISKGFATLETDNFFGTPWFEDWIKRTLGNLVLELRKKEQDIKRLSVTAVEKSFSTTSNNPGIWNSAVWTPMHQACILVRPKLDAVLEFFLVLV